MLRKEQKYKSATQEKIYSSNAAGLKKNYLIKQDAHIYQASLNMIMQVLFYLVSFILNNTGYSLFCSTSM